MRLSAAGRSTSSSAPDIEVLAVTPHGLWLSALGEEHLLRYDEHPWFRDEPVSKLFNVRLLHGCHLWWPDCDVDLHLDSLAHPEHFPLVSRPKPRRGKRAPTGPTAKRAPTAARTAVRSTSGR